uniref:Interleukin 32 n=1 Tax=Equus asinus TaxID=9793 RepID=A0A9L0K299_EQUAS
MYGVGWEGRVGTWGLLCEAENVLAHLRPRREKGQDSLSKLCLSSQRNTLDRWLDDIEVQSQGEGQVDLRLEDLEDKFSENFLDAVEEHHRKNNSESAPLLPDMKSELRRRAQKSSVPNPEPEGPGILEVEAPEAPEPEESFWVRAWRSFMGMLQRLKQRLQAVLAWVREKVAAGWQALCSVAQFINSLLESFCSYMAGLFRYHIQV